MLNSCTRIFLLALILLTTACASLEYVPPLPRQHMLQFNSDGTAADPSGSQEEMEEALDASPETPATPDSIEVQQVPVFRDSMEPLGDQEYEEYIQIVLDGLEDFAQDCHDDGPCRITFFIHGGLNSNRSSVRRVLDSVCGNNYETAPCDLRGPILSDGERYPIFILWNSGLTSSYFAHLFNIQRGRNLGVKGWPGAPWKLAADTGKALSRAPIVWYEMISHDLRTVPGQRLKRTVEEDAENYYRALEASYRESPTENTRVQRCNSQTSTSERVFASFAYAGTFASKFLLSPFIDGFGTVSWDVMLRRTDLLFEEEVFCAKTPDCDFELVPPSPLERVRSGGLAKFLDHLQAEIGEGGQLSDKNWEITLIGHSMGGIVMNRILNRYPGLPIKNIVYMASAATVRDYEESALPFLQANADKAIRIFHLVLNPVAELRERSKYADLSPRGSLLVWIDNFLSKPNTLEDRTMGRFSNITRALAATPAVLKPKISLTVFGVGKRAPACLPQRHGDFSDPKRSFWEEDFWLPDFAASAGCKQQ